MYEVVVGIDFGLSVWGFVHLFYNKNNIIHGNIYGANTNNKIPLEIILDYNNNAAKFENSCDKYLKEKGIEPSHYYKVIKMKLYEKKNLLKLKI